MNILAWQITLLSVLAGIVVATSMLGPNGGVPTLINTAHGFSCALWLGGAGWVAVFQGVGMLQILPRHPFGLVQGKMFPVLFHFGDVTCGIALATFLFNHPPATLVTRDLQIQAAALALAFLGSFINSILLVPAGNSIMWKCHKLEKDVGLGQTVRFMDMSKLAGNTTYHDLRARFFWWHLTSQVTAVISVVCIAYRTAFLFSQVAA